MFQHMKKMQPSKSFNPCLIGIIEIDQKLGEIVLPSWHVPDFRFKSQSRI
jgi:hypothetical protein